MRLYQYISLAVVLMGIQVDCWAPVHGTRPHLRKDPSRIRAGALRHADLGIPMGKIPTRGAARRMVSGLVMQKSAFSSTAYDSSREQGDDNPTQPKPQNDVDCEGPVWHRVNLLRKVDPQRMENCSRTVVDTDLSACGAAASTQVAQIRCNF